MAEHEHHHDRYRLGIDVGGTFTDLALFDRLSGALTFGKVLTTPDDPSRGVLQGVEAILAQAAVEPGAVEHVIHGTTLVGNAIIEHKGAKTALITTKGFRDTLTFRREFRYDIYESNIEFPKELVPRRWRFEVDERITAAGEVLKPLTNEHTERVIGQLRDGGFQAVGICLLHSYRNPAHEQQLAEAIQAALPGITVSTSSDVLAQIGEFERSVLTVMNAFVQPLVQAYLERLSRGLRDLGLTADLFCMSPNGGLMTPKTAARYPIRLLESGPVAGVLGAGHYGAQTGLANLLCFDMGGTTAKACVMRDGAPAMTTDLEVARVQRLTKGSGFPVKLPVIDILEIGAGGGSIARIDEVGLISVGPDSAGAAPGPVCYGRGGLQPTVTDANLILGYLNPDYFLGGAMTLNADGAASAFGELGANIELSSVRAAWATHEIVTQTMANALRTHAIEKGVDYRRFALFAFGGAGPVHAYRIAQMLKIPTVVYPWGAGVFSALGLLTAPLQFDLVRTHVAALDALDAGQIQAIYADLEGELRDLFAEAGVPKDQVRLTRSADVRYIGQGTDVEVPLPEIDAAFLAAPREALSAAFLAAYTDRFGWALESAPVEVTNWRCTARGPLPQMPLTASADVPEGQVWGRKGSRGVYVSDELGYLECAVYDRYELRPGQSLPGPALIEERECTIFIGPEATARIDEARGVVMHLNGAAE